LAPTAEKMRKEQTAKLAMTHVVRGAELTRQNKCFEAIQVSHLYVNSSPISLSKCFNKALAVDAECANAFVGRGAACAGMRNFEAALQDFDKVKRIIIWNIKLMNLRQFNCNRTIGMGINIVWKC
jgi:hypothetical protein